ncbi:MAG: GH3 auxin-responsive promoter family protein [Phycisphaerae bacterium]|nr:GH3 auxin-responsive promoter family protein [Phycisphaerae bacterium]
MFKALVDFIPKNVGLAHAKRMFHWFVRNTRKANEVQRQVLMAKIRRNADSDYGREHHFDEIRSYEDYVRNVPIQTYEDFRPYVERVKAGDVGALFHPREKIHMFSLTSGTTTCPKHIPVTNPFYKEYQRGWNIWGVKALYDHPKSILRCILQVTSPMDDERTEGGFPAGAITGLLAAMQKRIIRRFYPAPLCVAYVRDHDARYYVLTRLSVPADTSWIVTASPATVLRLARTADEHRERLLRDIHDGGISPDVDVPEWIRKELARRVRPNRKRARELERIVEQHGRLLPKHYWNIDFLANWTGGTMGLYLQDYPAYFGDVPVRDIGLLSSEGRMCIPFEDGTPAGVLEVTSHFFEFIPAEEYENDNPTILRSFELQEGKEYFLIVTTSSGLYRYDLGDRVRMAGWFNEAPLIEFLCKASHTSSLTGEKLTERQVISAVQSANQGGQWRINNFVMAPRWASPPYYVFHVERSIARNAERLAHAVDEELRRVNIEYDNKRSTDRLAPLAVNLVPDGYLAMLDRKKRVANAGRSEQYKHVFLYTVPGSDDSFPAADEL